MSEQLSVEELERALMIDAAAQLSEATGVVVAVDGDRFRLGAESLTIDEMMALLCAGQTEAIDQAHAAAWWAAIQNGATPEAIGSEHTLRMANKLAKYLGR